MSYALRPYQSDCLRAITGEFANVNSTLAVMATGLGKTVCFASLARDWNAGGVMVVAHRDELISQAAARRSSCCSPAAKRTT
jgi:superfamily II DNA or RNA helicase